MSDILPQGLRFLEIGWWLMHAVAVWLVYVWAYRRGRRDEKNAQLRAPAQSGGTRAPS